MLQQVTTASDPQAGMLSLMQEALNSRDSVLAIARSRGALLAASLGQDWSGFAAAFSEPLDQAWQSVMEPAAAALNGAWQQRVVNSWQEGFGGRYPFVSSTSDASVPLLAHFIAPQSGVVEQFVSQQLHGLVEKQGDEWVPVASAQQTLTVSPAFFNAINLLSRTGRLAFASGEANLRFDVQMRPQRGIMETTLLLDDAMLKYFNQQAEWMSFRWPDRQTASPQAVLSYIPLNQSGDTALPPETAQRFSGPWALIRLLDQSRREQIDGSRWRVSWSGRNGQPLSLILRTESYGGPLDLLKLRGFKLPAAVFSADGGGNDEQ
ncbi:type VI secretion IcmF C-terminal domain-containing protein [Type-D symbiont of Plautia stali]|uniref:type VI secretion IcmF C-terminal domain-containing protein n=1 Tax=Type-D symbiont of Plautia stali TaxID=1560356 RepID=UPI00073EAEAD|nr:type VI secretion IcmF C-terminal domain-containing protein [Type-D symbiont of Plautia stali]